MQDQTTFPGKAWPLFWACLFLLLPSPEAHGKGLWEMEARIGFQGHSRPLRWLPLEITLQSQGEALEDGWMVAMREGSRVARPVALPPFSKRSYFLYLPPEGEGPAMTVQLLREGEVLAAREVRLKPSGPIDLLGLLVSPQDSLTSWSEATDPNEGHGTFLAPVAADHLSDEWIGYDGIDFVILHPRAIRGMREEKVRALRRYLAAGGRLVVTGGEEASAYGTPFFQEVLPARVIDLAGLRLDLPSLPPTYGLVSRIRPKEGAEASLIHQGLPLAVRWKWQKGEVSLLAFDPFSSPFSGVLHGSKSLEEWLFAPSPRVAAGLPALHPGVEEFLPRQGDIPTCCRREVALFLLYALSLMGIPLIWKLAKRPQWLWIGIPLGVLLFTLAASAGTGRGSLSEVSILELYPGEEEAYGQAYLSVVPGRRGRYDLRWKAPSFFPLGTAVQEGSETERGLWWEGPRPALRKVRLSRYEKREVYLEGFLPLDLPLQATLSLKGPRVEGRLVNRSRFDLKGCLLLFQDLALPLPDLKAGTESAISGQLVGWERSLAGLEERWRGPLRSLMARLRDLTSEKGSGNLLGWIDQPLLGSALGAAGGGIEGRGMALVIYHDIARVHPETTRHDQG